MVIPIRFRLSVRGSMVLVLAIGVGTGWILHVVRTVQIQRRVVQAIEETAGTVAYDWHGEGQKRESIGRLGWPRWLVDVFGVDYFGRIKEVTLNGLHSDEVLTQLRQLDLSRIERLELDRSPVTDAGLAHLSGLSSLKRLYLFHNKVSDAGLASVGSLTSLQCRNSVLLDSPL